jgi:hypothetical protein
MPIKSPTSRRRPQPKHHTRHSTEGAQPRAKTKGIFKKGKKEKEKRKKRKKRKFNPLIARYISQQRVPPPLSHAA